MQDTKHRMQIFFLLLVMMHVLFPSMVSGSEGVEAVELRDKDQYHYASFLFKEEKYLSSAMEFGRLIEFFPASPLISDAQYKMAEAYLMAGMYKEAYEQFYLYLWNFPKGKYALKSIVKKGLAFDLARGSYPSILTPSVEHSKPSMLEANKSGAIRAVQILLFDALSYEEIEKDIKGLKEKGFNTLILRVFHNKGDRVYPFVSTTKTSGVYFQTKHAPVIGDVLGRFIDIAHKHGLKIFAWMTTRYADYGIEGRTDIRCKSYNFAMDDLKECRGLDLFAEEAVSHLEAIYQDLALYSIDGILFQDDLVLKHNEGFGKNAELLYLKDKGSRLIPANLYTKIQPLENGKYKVAYSSEFWEWSYWKNKRLINVAKRLMDVVRDKNPKVKFAINLMYESVSNPKGALAWLSQSLEEALKTDFDLYAIMAYHRQIQGELSLSYPDILQFISRMTRDALDKIKVPEKLIMKVQLVDWKTSKGLSRTEISDILHGILKEGQVSIAVVPYRKNLPVDELFAYYPDTATASVAFKRIPRRRGRSDGEGVQISTLRSPLKNQRR